jgi:hypothetical protein
MIEIYCYEYKNYKLKFIIFGSYFIHIKKNKDICSTDLILTIKIY